MSTKLIKFTVTGRIPSKKNMMEIRKRGRYSSIGANKKFYSWQESAMLKLLAQKVPKGKFVCSMVELRIYFPDNRRADLSNKTESIMDMMVEYGVINDDNWKCTGPVLMFPYYDKNKPRCEIVLWVIDKEKKIDTIKQN